mmetsp:Transcript_16667/g.19292  ORF Transcript_16667/g.19292 Transcript_16667/m.19292 type:complete len:285 (+) Transcript_16667:137-991(+)
MMDNNVDVSEKENINGNMLYPGEKLGRVPENSTFSGTKEYYKNTIAKKSIANMNMESYLDCGGEKHIAMINQQKAENHKLIMARKIFASPLQVLKVGKRSFDDDAESYDGGLKRQKTGGKRLCFDLDEKTRIGFFCGNLKLKRTKAEIAHEISYFVAKLNEIDGIDESKVFDSCPEIVSKIKTFLATYVMISRSELIKCLGVHGNEFNSFLQGKGQDKCDNTTYRKTYLFFERLRIYLGRPKTATRLQNERQYPSGFPLKQLTVPKQQKVHAYFHPQYDGYGFC